MKLDNRTKFDTNDLRRFVMAGIRALGARTDKRVVIVYARNARGCSGEATLGYPRHEARWLKLRIPNSEKVLLDEGGRYEPIPGARAEKNADGQYLLEDGRAIHEHFGPGSYRIENGVVERWVKPKYERRPYDEVPEDILRDLAHVLEHELDHNFGLEHAEMIVTREPRGDWWKGLRIRRKAEKSKPTPAERSAAREAHARKMAENWAVKAKALEKKLKAARSRCASWSLKLRYYEKKAARRPKR